ncbi:homeotic protein female sterile-like [Drosophila ananassae]|uniref:homeotic protein female sterile-like n=1 Tax=Drosophila ananassae TaxID=7217 RepID=UPI001CFF91C2|nr:homeotic protein female sterile-like [Drosophila ananassae]
MRPKEKGLSNDDIERIVNFDWDVSSDEESGDEMEDISGDRDRDRDRERRGGRGPGDTGVVNNLGKDVRGKKHDVKINIISDGGTGHAHPHRKLGGGASGSASSNRSRQVQGPGGQGSSPGHRSFLKLTAECLSNVTASTYCNGNGSGNGTSIAIPDDSSTNNYGDGEESSVVSSMMVPPQRWPPGGVALLRHKVQRVQQQHILLQHFGMGPGDHGPAGAGTEHGHPGDVAAGSG